MTDAAGSEAWAYDSMGRPLKDQRTANGVTKATTYTYNFDGSVASLSYPSGRIIAYTLASSGSNTAGRMASAVDSTGPINYTTSALYSPADALSSLTNGASLVSTLYFNNRLQPARIQLYGTGHGPANSLCPAASTDTTVGLDLGYAYPDASGHNNGNVTTIANNILVDRTQSFSYDSLNRLTSAWTAGINQPWFNGDTDYLQDCWAENYSYDPWGNLVSLGPSGSSSYTGCTQESGFNFTGSIAANNRIATSGYVYDAAGNLTTSPGAGAVTFDAENHMITAGGLSYAYDGDGNRTWKAPVATPTSPNLIYWYGGSGNLLQESDGAGNGQYSHIYFNGQRIKRVEWLRGGWFDHYGYDALGNARFVYGYNGATDVSDYYPFGGERAVSSAAGNKFKFTGKERDSESGLDNFGARFDSSVLGRFMSPDWSAKPEAVPYADLGNPQNLNLYAYVKDNPLNSTDPDGHCTKDGKERSWLWCFFHYSDQDALREARNFFQNNDIHVNGKHIDPDKMTDQELLKTWKDYNDWWQAQLATGSANPLGGGAPAVAVFWTSWGWSGTAAYNKAKNELRQAKTHEELNGKTPTREEATRMIEEIGGKVNRQDPAHPAGGDSTHTEPHINYTTPSGEKATVYVKD